MEDKRLVRRRGGFSDRNGVHPISRQIQLKTFERDTRTVLKNTIIEMVGRYKKSLGLYDIEFEPRFAKKLATELFCVPLNSVDASFKNICWKLYSVFDEGDYSEILDVVEYFAESIKIRDYNTYQYTGYFDLAAEFNEVFEKECIGYRFVNGLIEEITNKEEIQSIEESASTDYEKVNAHMQSALKKMSSRTNRDYKRVIAECCLALECLLNIILGKDNLTLGDAIKEYCKRNNKIHPALKESLLKFYGYASDSEGIRHDTNNKDFGEGFDEAKMILVNTSGFINYIVSANKSLE